jgi:oxygen-independent coproporphyrinogen-3 oxidase
VSNLRPDRIAFYSYAHLPSAFPSQKSFEKFLPKESEKRFLYEKGKVLLNQMGYMEIGMDHFGLPEDALYVSKIEKSLHRNFMGYTTSPSKILLGLGNSSISDVHFAYGQNTKEIDLYKEQIMLGHLALSKGHVQTKEDVQTKKMILELICNQKTEWNLCFYSLLGKDIWDKLKGFQSEGLIRFDTTGMEILEAGAPFIRNICMVFDKRMKFKIEKKFTFSKAI